MKLLFIYEHYYADWWEDGLWAALKILERDYNIYKWNIAEGPLKDDFRPDFTLGWGAFESGVDRLMMRQMGKKGLCIAGNAIPPHGGIHNYDVLFHETEWYRNQVDHSHMVHAFGINTNIYKDRELTPIWDVISVGAFALWKRQELLLNKKGFRIAVGEVQKRNLSESLGIIGELAAGGVAISPMVTATRLSMMYNLSNACYIPANVVGGGERAVLEARACGIPVEVENDNPKLKELCYSDIYDEVYYASQLKKGIEACLQQ